MNDSTTTFAVPKSRGNAQQRMFQNILQYRGVRLQNAVVRWLGGRSGNIVPKPVEGEEMRIEIIDMAVNVDHVRLIIEYPRNILALGQYYLTDPLNHLTTTFCNLTPRYCRML